MDFELKLYALIFLALMIKSMGKKPILTLATALVVGALMAGVVTTILSGVQSAVADCYVVGATLITI